MHTPKDYAEAVGVTFDLESGEGFPQIMTEMTEVQALKYLGSELVKLRYTNEKLLCWIGANLSPHSDAPVSIIKAEGLPAIMLHRDTHGQITFATPLPNACTLGDG